MNELSTVSVKDMAPEQLGGEIRLLTAQARRMALSYGIQIGYRLKIAHEKVGPHGWAEWLKRETEFSAAAASRFETLYEGYGDEQGSIFGVENKFPTLEKLSISNALRLLAIPEEEREDFAREVDAEHLSARELEAKVKERTAEIEAEKERMEKAHAAELYDAETALDEATEARDAAEIARKEAENAREVAEIARRDAENDREAAEKAQRDAEEQLRRIKEELDEIEKRPAATVYVPDEEAIAKAANAAAEAERAKHEKAEKELKEQIAALTGQVKTETGTRKKLEKQLREAEEKEAAAQKDGAEAEALRGQIDGLKKQLALAAPEVADFKAAFGRAQEELNHMLDAIDRIGDEGTRGKLKKAGLAMMEAYAGRLGA